MRRAVRLVSGTPNTGNTNNFYNVTAAGASNNNNASNSYGVLCGFPPKRLPNGRKVTPSMR